MPWTPLAGPSSTASAARIRAAPTACQGTAADFDVGGATGTISLATPGSHPCGGPVLGLGSRRRPFVPLRDQQARDGQRPVCLRGPPPGVGHARHTGPSSGSRPLVRWGWGELGDQQRRDDHRRRRPRPEPDPDCRPASSAFEPRSPAPARPPSGSRPGPTARPSQRPGSTPAPTAWPHSRHPVDSASGPTCPRPRPTPRSWSPSTTCARQGRAGCSVAIFGRTKVSPRSAPRRTIPGSPWPTTAAARAVAVAVGNAGPSADGLACAAEGAPGRSAGTPRP